jgi:predicted TPR repeat methyltransferase
MQVVIQSLITGLFVGLLGLWVNSRLEQLKGDLQSKMDALVRERELYEKLGPALRAFTPEGTAEQKAAFEEAYALAYIWASEEVLKPLDAFIAHVTLDNGQVRGTQEERNRAYEQCMLSLRQAAGHSDTKIKYRRVSF